MIPDMDRLEDVLNHSIGPAFVAAAREWLPVLLREIRGLQKETLSQPEVELLIEMMASTVAPPLKAGEWNLLWRKLNALVATKGQA